MADYFETLSQNINMTDDSQFIHMVLCIKIYDSMTDFLQNVINYKSESMTVI